LVIQNKLDLDFPLLKTHKAKMIEANLLDCCKHLTDALCMRAMDRRAIEELGLPGLLLMENAARAVADWLEQSYPNSKRICVCCGKGNNGGDGYAAARLLANRGYSVSVVCLQEPQTSDAQQNFHLWQNFGPTLTFPEPVAVQAIQEADVVLDAIFGVGLQRPIIGLYMDWIAAINASSAAVIGVDLPSGTSADDSQILGTSTRCVATVTFQVPKIGLWQYPGREQAGEIHVVDVCIPPHWPTGEKSTYLLTEDFFCQALPKRPITAHKGTFGHLLVLGGQVGMAGAVQLASQAALQVGTGLVTAAVPSALRDRLLDLPEVMTWSASQTKDVWQSNALPELRSQLSRYNALVVGCGIGASGEISTLLEGILREVRELPVLIDADGLNALDPDWLRERETLAVLTPHPGELSRLIGQPVSEFQQQRVATVRHWSQTWGVVLLLKGALTVIGTPEGQVFINPTGNPGMATAGSGDVLSGMIGGLLAQGLNPLEATLLGCWWHGSAGDWQAKRSGEVGLTAGRLVEGISPVWQQAAS
jgi:NAD(P)H-hydrate epimerase